VTADTTRTPPERPNSDVEDGWPERRDRGAALVRWPHPHGAQSSGPTRPGPARGRRTVERRPPSPWTVVSDNKSRGPW